MLKFPIIIHDFFDFRLQARPKKDVEDLLSQRLKMEMLPNPTVQNAEEDVRQVLRRNLLLHQKPQRNALLRKSQSKRMVMNMRMRMKPSNLKKTDLQSQRRDAVDQPELKSQKLQRPTEHLKDVDALKRTLNAGQHFSSIHRICISSLNIY